MTGPYRALSPAATSSRRDPEASVIYALLALLGVVRLVIAVVLHEPFGAEATVALALAVLGTLGLVRDAR